MAFELQGHRGARGLFAENTVCGFVATLALGVDAVELDVGVTADGVPVVFHDVALGGDIVRVGRCVACGRGSVGAVADAGGVVAVRCRPIVSGSRYEAAHPEQAACDGSRVPTLREVFAATGSVRLHAELKTLPDRPQATVAPAEMAALVLEAAAACAALGRLDVRSFDWRGLRHVRACRPEVGLTFLTDAATVARAELWWDAPGPAAYGGSVPRAVAAQAVGASWAPEHRDLTVDQVREAKSLGLRVVPWTVNAPEDMARLISWGWTACAPTAPIWRAG